MKIPVWLSTILVTAFIGAHGWLIVAVIDLKTDMAGIKAILSQKEQQQQTTIATK
jgi:hypothetical protein